MNAYLILLSLHVVAAILGVGQLGSATVLASFGANTPVRPLQVVLRFVIVSLGLMLLSGVGLEALAHGGHSETGWFRLSFALLLLVGFLHSRARRWLQTIGDPANPAVIRRVSRLLWIMCAGVAVIAFLMEAKPF